MNKIAIKYHKTAFGELILGSINEELCLCDWRYRKKREAIDQRIQFGLLAEYNEGASDVIDRAIAQLDEYEKGNRESFDLPLRLVGTDFQQKVWNQLIQIPFGKTKSYLDLSKELGDVKAIRAVASANGANAVSIIVPCHRIIGSDGSLTGYAGGLNAKEKLLKHEGFPLFNQTSLF